jgi:dihydropteroate synthase
MKEVAIMDTPLPESGQTIQDRPDNLKRGCFDVPYPQGILNLGTKTYVMGILNVTPDSFYDGKRYATHESAVEHALDMVSCGADIIDVGGESTRPGASPVAETEEITRVIPLIKLLSKRIRAPISIDTYKAAVAERAIDAGASIINDIGGLRMDKEMARVAAASQVPVIIMHKKGSTRTMQKYPLRKNACAEIRSFLKKSISLAVSAGVKRERIIVDPGIGFGKTAQQNLEILRRLREFASLGFPVLVGTSRKKFIGAVLDIPVHERLYGTLATLAVAVMNGAHIVRVHDVREAVQVVTLCDAIGNQ